MSLTYLAFSYFILSSIVSTEQAVGVERLVGHLLVYKSQAEILPLLFSTPAQPGLYLFLAPCRAVFAAICLHTFCSLLLLRSCTLPGLARGGVWAICGRCPMGAELPSAAAYVERGGALPVIHGLTNKMDYLIHYHISNLKQKIIVVFQRIGP